MQKMEKILCEYKNNKSKQPYVCNHNAINKVLHSTIYEKKIQ